MDHGGFLCSIFVLWLLASSFSFNTLAEAQGVGVNYGMLGNNLPTPEKVVALYTSRNVTKLRIFNPDANALKALEGSGIEVILGTYNQDLQKLSSDQSYATNWVQTNVIPYANSVNFRYINAGNEVIPGDLATYVLPAMQNLDTALKAANISIPVTTAVATTVLGTSYPPSQGAFSESASSSMASIVSFLESQKYPLLVNAYPYFAYANSPNEVRLDYALFTAQGVVVQDGQLGYTNLFDAIVDATYSALEKAGGSNVDIVVSETGWPSGGGAVGATVDNARTYNNNMVAYALNNTGTPRRPGKGIETYLFAMFNENQKPAGTEQYFGLYRPDMTEVYHVDFSS
ncbi:putative glucan endo-1,3-beta-glucosidase GVI [Elaeis guineensis]|uniref:Glucan endo-1,3-beta-glucosidase GVI n=1 Tax=Elaeis guineensis var. tenera TaxID=51953 RepID=A0A6I9REZ6_ELAGV|nr:putative glucan endo-1,3-beta-glucosidase GVI [Elaeis guineensis]